MAIFREDEPGAMKRPDTSEFQGGAFMDTSTAAAKAIRGAAQRAMEAGSETDDWVGLLGTIIGGAAAAAIPGIGVPAAIGIGTAAGTAAQGATKMIEGVEPGGGRQLLAGIGGTARGVGAATPKAATPTPLPPVPDVTLTPPAAAAGELPDITPSFRRKK